MLLEEEYEQVRVFKQRPGMKTVESSGEDVNAAELAKDETTNGEAPTEGDIIGLDAMAEDEPPSEMGSQAIEKRLTNLALESPEPDDEVATKAFESKRVSALSTSPVDNI